ncbi:MAG: DUF2155 domain-containing protein [Acetobacteraceae bacterium]|nr:DUF2155 domain-containing protein [Acetobacteraceae bacterium]
MRRTLLAALLLLPLSAFAQEATQPQPQDWLPKRVAELQMLDKVTARVTVLRAPVGQPMQFGALTILVRACDARPPDEVPDAAAFLEMTDSRRPADAQEVFRGWMFANAPGVNMLEHPVYDVRVLDCR